MNICLFTSEEISKPLNKNDERAQHIIKVLHRCSHRGPEPEAGRRFGRTEGCFVGARGWEKFFLFFYLSCLFLKKD